MLIARSIWNGIARDPKNRKSKAPVPIIPKLAAKLEAHRARLGNLKTAPMFPNAAGKAVDPDSLLRRVIFPALEVLRDLQQASIRARKSHPQVRAKQGTP